MRIFEIIVLIGIIAVIVMGAFFSSAMFQSVSLEGNSTHETETVTGYEIVNAWIWLIALILIIVVVIAAFKFFF
jgi:uncharacterized membrane protein